jgi:type-F conjugative transfer system pilin assembly protein TrbC
MGSMIGLIFLSSSLIGTEWIQQAQQNVSQEAIEWAQSLTKEKKKCSLASFEIPTSEAKVKILISFSMPDSLILSLSKQMESVHGSFVLNGIPNVSFQEFAEKIKRLRFSGVLSEFVIDPDLFTSLEVDRVPFFIATDGTKLASMSGNVSLSHFLREAEEKAGLDLEKLKRGGRDA